MTYIYYYNYLDQLSSQTGYIKALAIPAIPVGSNTEIGPNKAFPHSNPFKAEQDLTPLMISSTIVISKTSRPFAPNSIPKIFIPSIIGYLIASLIKKFPPTSTIPSSKSEAFAFVLAENLLKV